VVISAKPFVFVSYSRRDTELMRELVEQLEFFADEVDWYLDERDIRSGQMFEDVIDEALDRTMFAVLLVSPGFDGSDYIRDREFPALLDEGVALASATKSPGSRDDTSAWPHPSKEGSTSCARSTRGSSRSPASSTAKRCVGATGRSRTSCAA
jgi:hypothetical protein